MVILRFKEGLFEKYKSTVKDCDNLDYHMACLKMTRNMMLAKEEKSPNHPNSTMYKYGSLWFVVSYGKITWIRNNCHVPEDWQLDKKEYVRLSRELGIDKNVTVMDLYIKEAKGKLKYGKNKLKWKLKGLMINNG